MGKLGWAFIAAEDHGRSLETFRRMDEVTRVCEDLPYCVTYRTVVHRGWHAYCTLLEEICEAIRERRTCHSD